MENNLTLQINSTILHQAFQYADAKGVNLSKIVESFLLNLVQVNKEDGVKNFPISDKVKSLAARVQENGQNIDWKEDKEEYLKQKYGL